MAEDLLTVKYEGNVDPRSGTGVIRLGDDRKDITLDGTGQVTQNEFNRLVEGGLILTPISEKEAEKEAAEPSSHSHGSGAHMHEMDFSSMSSSDLQSLADAHDMDVKGTGAGGNVTKKDLEDALAKAHS